MRLSAIEPVHPAQGGQLEAVDPAERVVAKAFELVEPDHRLGHGVVVALSDLADRGQRAGLDRLRA